MLEQYYVKPETSDRVRASWIGEPVEKYVKWLNERGFKDRSVLHRIPILVRFGQFAEGRGATSWDELPALVEPFVALVHGS